MSGAAGAAGSPDAPGAPREEVGPGGVGFLLGVAHRARRRRWERALADLGLSAPQAAVLALVASTPGLGVRDLARRLGTDPMNAQRITESLLAAGLCRSGQDPGDARRRPLHPTAAGRQLARTVAGRAGIAEARLRDELGEEAYRSLAGALAALVDHDSAPGDR